MLPATKSMPKEMLPLVDKPIIQYLVEELVEAGIEDIIMVTKWDKKPLEDHFDRNLALERGLEKGGKKKRLKEIKKISEMANFIYVRQDPQYGNGVPILSAASLVKNEPFVFCYGDDLVKSKVSFTKQMVDEYKKVGYPMIGVQEVPIEDVVLYGMMKLKKGTMQLEGIIEKPTVKETPSRFANFGRMILNQDIIDILAETPLGKGGELWTVDAIEEYIRRGGKFYAKAVEDGEWITTGDPVSYLKAILKYAFDREDINKELKKFLKTQTTK
ncbi:MAG: UTP--glucose-1-phosphate uridylyltransferase [Candidatus Pacebacteria bacterium]|nr:UTP--glucose-1-phosphate uridylyltransferase [Candidatus Paceibacterota bacterium]